jgi:hypothetical protein
MSSVKFSSALTVLWEGQKRTGKDIKVRYLQGRSKVAYAQWIPKLWKGQEVWKSGETAKERMGWKLLAAV